MGFTELCKLVVICSLDDNVWDVRMHFDGQQNLDRKLCSSDVTFLNLYALMETQGYRYSDALYHMDNTGIGEQREKGLELIDSNLKLQQIKKQYEETRILNLLVRATEPVSSVYHREELAPIVYQPPVVYDLSEPPVLAVDDQGIIFESQCSSYSAVQPPAICTQESRNVRKDKLKAVMEEEKEEGYKSADNFEGAYNSDNNPFYMEEHMPKYNEKDRVAEDTEIQEGRRLAEEELAEEEEEESDEESEEEQLHYEGDTEVEDLFELEDDVNVVSEEEQPIQEPVKKRQKLPVRRGPTTRSHSSVLEEVKPDFKPSSDEEETGLLLDSEDDGFEPLAFVLPKGRKSRAKKRPPRKWYNEKLEQPHQQLCLQMCFRDQRQFRDALLSLHIT